jgi:hypothetical protein
MYVKVELHVKASFVSLVHHIQYDMKIMVV